MRTMRTRAPYLFLCLPLLFVACGDGDTPTNTPPPTTTSTSIPASAKIDVEILSASAASSGQGNLFQVGVRITESGGVGAHINFARLEVFRATGELEERQEIGAGQIIAGIGDNRLEPNMSEDAFITFFFRATVKKGRQLRLTMGFTDDQGNDLETINNFTFI